jgi:hypothetical protein
MDTTGLEPRLANVLRNYYKHTFTDPVTWSRTESIRFEGTLHLPQGVLRFTAFKKKPDYTKVVIFAQNGGRLVMAYDGSEAWQLQALPSSESEAGNTDPPSFIPHHSSHIPQTMPEADARNFVRDATTGGHLLYPRIEGKKIELLGVAKVDRDRLYELQVTLPDGQVIRSYLDPTSFLEVRQVTVNNASGDEEVTTHSDFRSIDGIRVPFTSTLTIDGKQVHQSRLSKVETNTGVMPWMFSRPSGDYLPSRNGASLEPSRNGDYIPGPEPVGAAFMKPAAAQPPSLVEPTSYRTSDLVFATSAEGESVTPTQRESGFHIDPDTFQTDEIEAILREVGIPPKPGPGGGHFPSN